MWAPLIDDPRARHGRPARLLLCAFALAVTGDLVAISVGLEWARWATKPSLMLLLLGLVAASGRIGRPVGRVLAAGLAFAWAADIALLVDGTPAFLTGMALFGVMQVCYLAVFLRLGAPARLLRRWPGPVCYLAVWAVANLALWPRLESLAPPVAVYSLLLVSMGAAAVAVNAATAWGGALFVASDLMLGLGVAGIGLPGQDQAVMATYAAAQLLITAGCLRELRRPESRTAHSGPDR
ncbi:lysoplasmalogenase [Glycomyces xiaoerkulensis]|uniref:lysoplasmalogenase n=1 Tax=Glycomyces xiaoerkulensis TaxID=2038139 RepID=UPI000C26BDFC|nr:lysoplasmalogenase [Glycomyces xiaoerkulensis]